MIISASRRTDIPAFYSDWFFNRIKEKYVLVRNPMNIHQVSRVSLEPEVVDCIVFWTKNPGPMLERLNDLKDYDYYFQFTLNSYGDDIEINVPSKNVEIIDTFIKLSDKIGSERVIWRYDPILLNPKYTMEYHVLYFEKIAKRISGYTNKCTISFIDLYRNTMNNVKDLQIREISKEDKRLIAKELSSIAQKYDITMDTCAEDIDLEDINVSHAKCIDGQLISRITGASLNIDKDKNQRLECGCVESIDIGAYNTCKNLCKYCYANYSKNTVEKNYRIHDKNSPLLFGILSEEDKITERDVKSLKERQISIFTNLKHKD